MKVIPSQLSLMYFLSTVSMSSFFHDGNQNDRYILQGSIFFIAILICFTKSIKTFKTSIFVAASLSFFAIYSKSPFVVHLSFNIMIATYVLNTSSLEDSLSRIWNGSAYGLAAVVLMCATGIVENSVIYVHTSDTFKNSLGFFNPNVPGMVCAGLLITSLITKNKKHIIISACMFAAAIYLSQSRSSIGFVSIFLFSRILLWRFTMPAKQAFCTLIYLAGCIISIMLIYISELDPLETLESVKVIDDILSKRLHFAIPEITSYGSALPGIPSKNLDFAWANIFIIFGGIFTLAYFAVMTIMSLRIDKTYSDIFYLSTSVMFASLFTENISYVYYSLGVIFAMPTAIALNYAQTDLFGRRWERVKDSR